MSPNSAGVDGEIEGADRLRLSPIAFLQLVEARAGRGVDGDVAQPAEEFLDLGLVDIIPSAHAP